MLILSDSELSPLMTSSETSVVPCRSSQSLESDIAASGAYQEFPGSPQLPHPGQRQHLHQWDINDNTLPTPDTHDLFELWPTGHSRRVYRADSDDARRHVSGWAMRNTNNHNALILKKSCLGVLVCSMDCMLETGRKVHLRPAICDKARRKQIGKPCPNPGCPGKLDLLSCRGHCGYPVTHFWRHVNGYVYFQAKGFHDHPRPEVKSLSEKGRHAFTKQLKHEGDRFHPTSLKRRFPILTNEEIPDKKMFLPKQDEVMCSCPPFECVCPKSHSHMVQTSLGFLKDTHTGHFLPHRPHSGVSAGMEQLAAAPFTQINITNTCLPPSTVDVSIPGYDLYKNCSRLGFHPYYLNGEMQMINSYGSKEDHTSPFHTQTRGHVSEYRPNESIQCSSLPHGHIASISPRSVSAFSSTEERDDSSMFRLSTNQHFCTTPPLGDARAQVVKAEPGSSFFCSSRPSSPPHSLRAYQTDIYRDMSPGYQSSSPASPRLEDCQPKFNSAPDDYGKDQLDQQQEPTYITLTTPQRNMGGCEAHEYNSCRIGHTNRSPSTAACSTMDAVLYPAQPTQITRVDSSPGLHVALRTPQQKDIYAGSQVTHVRRSPASLPLRSANGNTEALNAVLGNPQRGNNIPPSLSIPSVRHDPAMTPHTTNNNPCVSTFPTSSNSYTSLGAPYSSYFCNEMFPTPSQQAYRNRSINITLTYN